MIKSYILTAFRFLLKNKAYSLLNISGLIVGISFSCMLFTYVRYELSFDSFQPHASRTVRVMTRDRSNTENGGLYNVTVPPVGPELVRSFPEAQTFTRLFRFTGQVVFEINGENYMERDWYAADSTFFKVFRAKFIHGDESTALSQPSSIVLTATAAMRYFGDLNIVGRVLEKSNLGPLKVTGVIEDAPQNSHLSYNILISPVFDEPFWKENMNNWNFGLGNSIVSYTYLVLKDEQSKDALATKLPAFARLHFGEKQSNIALELQPLREIYLHSNDVNEEFRVTRYGNMSYVYIFSTMAVFLIVIAAVNYINLATTRAMSRAREVGMRKVAGAHKLQLMSQYLVESLSITIIAMLVSIAVMNVTFPYFNEITGRNFGIRWATIADYLPSLLIISLVIGLVAGIYPALYLASLKPVHSLRTKGTSVGANASLRQILVVGQFALSILMIISTFVVGKQMRFIQSKDLGFAQDNLMVIDINNGNVRRNFQTMKTEYLRIAGVNHVATSSRVPGEWKNIASLYAPLENGVDSTNLYFMGFDEDMLETYQFRLSAGRFFGKNTRNDSTSIVINEAAADALGMKDPLGKIISLHSSEGRFPATIVGVLKNFNFQSLHQKVAPIVIGAWNNPIQSIDYFTLKFSGDVVSVVEAATRVHEQFDLRTPIEYHFLDQQLATFYDNERRASMIFKLAALLSISVACLGLSGLAAYNIQRRVKELGVRKVLGATPSQLFMLLSSSFVKQIVIAFVIASPIAWLVMNRWLESFQYRVSQSVVIFLLAGLSALAIAFVTIGYGIFSATRANPVDALRNNE